MKLLRYKNKIDVSCETVECILEGLIINNIIEHTPFASDLFYSMKSCVQTKLKNKASMKQWFSQFFISELSISNKVDIKLDNIENFTEINKYVMQKGKFKIVEKHVFFNEEIFNSFYATSFLKLKKKLNESADKLDSKILRELIIKAIIIYKRGILLDNYRIFLFFNKILSLFTINCVSFVHGDSIHADEESIRNITAEWKVACSSRSNYFGSVFDMKTNFFSLSNRTVPFWINVEQKRGIIIIKGVPVLGEQDHHYKLEVIGPNKKHLFYFWIKIYRNLSTLYKVYKGLSSWITMTEKIIKKKTMSNSALVERAREYKKKYQLNTKKKQILTEISSPTIQVEASGYMNPDLIDNNSENFKIEMMTNPIANSILVANINNNTLMTEIK